MSNQKLTKHFRNAVAVFEGGGVRGAAYAGAYHAAVERGVRIRAVAGTSAGSIAAALVAASVSPQQMKDLFQKDFLKNLLSPSANLSIKTGWLAGFITSLPGVKNKSLSKAYRQLGSYSSEAIENWLNEILSKQLKCPGKTVKFGQLTARPLYVIAANIRESRVKLWSTYDTPDDSVAFAVRCSCSIPFFFQPASNNTHAFVDGGILSNLPLHAAGKHQDGEENYPILAFRLESDPELYPPMPESAEGMLHQIADTIISGHSEMELQLSVPCAQIKIPTGKISSTNFKLSDKETTELISSGEKATHEFFDREDTNVANLPSLTHRPEATERGMWLDRSMREINSAVKQIVLFGGDCSWIVELGPCLMLKKKQGLDVRVIFDVNEHPAIDPLQVMPFFGCEVRKSTQKLWLRGALIDAEMDDSTLILSDKNPEATSRFGRILRGSTDRRLIQLVKSHFNTAWDTGEPSRHQAIEPILEVIQFAHCERALRKVAQYQRATFAYQPINPREIAWSTTALEPFKLSRVEYLSNLLERLAIEKFNALWIKGTPRVIAPPILEEHDGRLVLIDGHHRMFFCIENGIAQATALVIKGAHGSLPSSIVDSWELLKVLPQRLPRHERYAHYKAEHWRSIGPAIEALGLELFRAATTQAN